MNWKKLCSAALAVALLIGSGSVVSAKTTVPEQTIFDLKSLGIIQGDESGDLNLDEAVTRAEFTAMMMRLVQMEDWRTTERRTEFSDVSESDWFYHAVYCMVDLGVIHGDGDGSFRPEEPVSAIEAMKILVTVLGYDAEAEQAGGYPEGYRVIAVSSGIARGVDLEGSFTRADAMVMIDNCLDLYLYEPSYGPNDGPVFTDQRETLRDRLMGKHSTEKLYEVKGVVQATASTWIIPGSYQDLEDDQIVIDGLLYRTSVLDAANLIGKQVECYVAVKEDVRTIQSIRETNQNTVLEIRDEDLVTADAGVISYQTDEKVKNVRLSDTAVLLHNMRLVETWSEDDIKLSQGTVTLIDNDGDKAYDVIHIQEFETYLISDVGENRIYFKLRENGQEKKYINFQENDAVQYRVTDQDGTLLEIADLKADMAVSVFESRDGTSCQVVTGPESFSASLESVREDSFCFDGEEYEAEKGFIDPYELGNQYQVYLNYRNELFLLDDSKSEESVVQYGYVAEVVEDGVISPQLMAKVVLPGDFVEVEEKSLIEDDDTVTLKLKGQNKAVEEMTFASRVSVNGEKMDTAALKAYFTQNGGRSNRLISYRTNAVGEISRIATPEVQGRELAGRDEKRIYNAKEKIFGGMLVGAFGATEQTKVLMIPDYDKQGAVEDEDYYAVAEINDQQAYTVNGYDVYGERECVKVITIMTTLQYDASAAILDTDKMALVEEINRSLDEEGNEVVQLVFWSDGVKMTYVVEEEKSNLAESMAIGDIFYYAVSPSSNEINKLVRVDNAINPDRGMGQFGQPGDSNPEGMGQITAGVVTDITYEKIADLSNRRKDRLEIDLGNGEVAELYINSRNAPAIYLYDTNRHTAEAVTSRDILLKEGHVMVHVKNNTVRGLVVVR